MTLIEIANVGCMNDVWLPIGLYKLQGKCAEGEYVKFSVGWVVTVLSRSSI